MNIVENLEWRYAVKKFDSERILPQEKIDKLKITFNLTATSYGLQPIRMVIVQNKDLQEKLVPFSMKQPQVGQASHVLVFCIEKNIDNDYIIEYFERVKSIRQINEEVLAPFKNSLLSNFSSLKNSELQNWAKNQAYLAIGNLLTVCAIEKIDSCPMEGFQPESYDQLLGLSKKGLTSVLVMPIGYRAEDDMFSEFKKVRRDLNESIIEIS